MCDKGTKQHYRKASNKQKKFRGKPSCEIKINSIISIMYLTAQSEETTKVYSVTDWLLQWPACKKACVKSSKTLYSNSFEALARQSECQISAGVREKRGGKNYQKEFTRSLSTRLETNGATRKTYPLQWHLWDFTDSVCLCLNQMMEFHPFTKAWECRWQIKENWIYLHLNSINSSAAHQEYK